MKTITFRSAMFGFLLLASSFSFANTVKTESQEVTITPVENLYLGKTAEKVWMLNYSEKEKPVTVTMHQVGNSKEYIVRSAFFEIAYVSGKQGFGVTTLPRSLREIPEEINYSVLNKQQLENQKILTPNQITEDDALKLIASYLPDLLNENYKHLLY
jgi:hypothetical protein